ncbi:MAG TPA: hypothetical protein VM689_13480 [Aliidongia sp.]|nr:hypothetical protein [Aliidongia sp.]
MAKLELRAGMLPELLQEIARLTTVSIAVSIAREWGGGRLYFPRKMAADHRLARRIGLKAATRLCRELGGEKFEIPAARHYLRWLDARALRVLRLSHQEIAELLKVNRKRVAELLEGFDPQGIELDELVLVIGLHYRVKGRARSAGRMKTEAVQRDFGFPPAPGGMRYTYA